VVALSSCEAEYIAASTASTQALWLVGLLGDLLDKGTRAVELRVDSKSALTLAKNPIFHEWNKHIRVRYHFIRGCLEEGSFKACYINTKDQLADLLTKPLGRIKFLELCSRIGMVQLSHKMTHKTYEENDGISLVLLVFVVRCMVVRRTHLRGQHLRRRHIMTTSRHMLDCLDQL
jgi:hypothetical protein